MSISRRRMLQSSGAVMAAASAPAFAFQTKTLTIFDSRHPPSRALAYGSNAKLDVAHEDSAFWHNIRSGPLPERIEGLTAWSDWVVVRGLLEERGKRVRTETPRGALFHWTMS